MVKFSSKMDPKVLAALRAHARATGRPIALLLSEAVKEMLDRKAVRPAFAQAAANALAQYDAALTELAK